MNFVEEKNIEVINCDYEKLHRKKEKTENENNELKKKNKSIKAAKTTKIVLLTLLFCVIFGAIGLALWVGGVSKSDSAAVGAFRWGVLDFLGLTAGRVIDTYPAAWNSIPYVLFGIYVLLVVLLYITIVVKVVKEAKHHIKPLNVITESELFAEAEKNKLIGNLTLSTFESKPYIVQKVHFSCELGAEGSSVVDTYNTGKQWTMVLIPGLFRKYIDVEHTMLLLPYINENETILTAEDALIHERMLRRKAEMQVETVANTYKQNIIELKEQLRMSRSEVSLTSDKLYSEQQKNARLKEFEKRCAENEASLQEAKANYENKISELSMSLNTANEELSKAKSEVASVKNELADESAKLRVAIEKKDEAEAKYNNVANEYKEKMQASENESRKSLNAYKDNATAQIIELQKQIKEKDAAISKFESESQDADRSKAQLEHDEKTSRERAGRLEKELEICKNENAELKRTLSEYESLVNQNKDSSEKLTQEQNGRKIAEQTTMTLRAQNANLQERVDALEKDNASLRHASENISELYDEKNNLIKRNDALVAELEEVKSDYEKLQQSAKNVAQLETENKRLRGESIDAKAARDRAIEDVARLNSENASQKSYITNLEQKLEKAGAALKQYISEKGLEDKEKEEAARRRREEQTSNFEERKRVREQILSKSREPSNQNDSDK